MMTDSHGAITDLDFPCHRFPVKDFRITNVYTLVLY